jgi:acetyl-CoA carboxylase biotin carboxylase subunit
MVRAIDEYTITGITTTLGFGKFVIQHPAFRSGDFDTHFVSKYFTADSLHEESEDEALIAALGALMQFQKATVGSSIAEANIKSSNWKRNRSKY